MHRPPQAPAPARTGNSLTCSLVLHPPPPTSGPSGITLKWSSAFTHTSGDTCSQQSWSTRAPSQIKIYDGLTPFAPLLAMQNLSGWEGSTEWGCDVKVTVSTSGRSLLLETTMMGTAAAAAGWTARWGQAEGRKAAVMHKCSTAKVVIHHGMRAREHSLLSK